MKHLSPWVLDQMVLGTLASSAEAEGRAHLEDCSTCRHAHEERQRAEQQFNAERTLPRLQARRRGGRLRTRMLAVGGAMAAAAAVIAVFFVDPAEPPGLQIKGDCNLRVFAKRGEAVFPVETETVLEPGDRIRFLVESIEPGYLLVVGKDGTGNVSVYVPHGGPRSIHIPAGRTELPGSIELDDAPGPEELFALFTPEPLEADAAVRAINESGEAADHVVWTQRVLKQR